MNTKSTLVQAFASALIITTAFLPAAAFARDGQDSGAVVPVSTSLHVEAEGGGEGMSVRATTTVGMRVSDENDNSKNHINDDEASSTGRHGEGERQSINSGHESEEVGDEIEIDHDSAANSTTTIDAPEHVTTHGELRSFLNHIVKGDDHISDVHVSSSTIETHYEMPAKFLWAIPMNLTADVSVNSNGSVTISYPWYAFLFAKHDSALATQLTQSVTSVGTTTLSASAQAQLLTLLFSNLKSSSEQ